MIEERTKICKHCPICNVQDWICSGSLYLNPITNDISIISKEGYIKGCNCLLKQKIANKNKRCPAGKW